MKYEIEIPDNIGDETNDAFELNADNVLAVSVYDKHHNNVSKDHQVILFFSKSAMIGLGTELIRYAHRFNEGSHVHLDPAKKEWVVQSMGVFLHPDSCETIICCNDFECIDKYLEE